VTKYEQVQEFRDLLKQKLNERDQLEEFIEDIYLRIDKLTDEIEYEKSHTYNQV
jgi:predicted house-cleaning noncanonical NTP pyrophosphatase (MazG superfamily)